MNTIQAVREQQDAIDALPDRDYIKTICSVMIQMIDNPLTRNLDFTEARNLCKQFAEAIEVQLEQQASNITEPEEQVNYETDGDETLAIESFVKEHRKPTIDEAKAFLVKQGFTISE